MALTQEQINKLLALPTRKRRTATGPDTSLRDYQTWFKLAQEMVDKENGELLVCSNPNCSDPRKDRPVLVAKVNGQYMCRHCFLAGFLLPNENQTTL